MGGMGGGASLGIFARYHIACEICYIFYKIQWGSGEWVWGVKSHIFGTCQKVFLVFIGIKIKMVFRQIQ